MRAGKELLLVRMPTHNRYLTLWTFETIQLILIFSDVKDLDLITFASREEPIPVDGIPADLIDGIIVRRYSYVYFWSSSRIPDPNVVIFAPRDY